MVKEVARDEFLAHVASLFDGATDVPGYYTYPAEVRLDFGSGPKVSSEAWESFRADGKSIIMTRPGSEGITFPQYRDSVLQSLNEFLDAQPFARFFIGEARGMSLWARTE